MARSFRFAGLAALAASALLSGCVSQEKYNAMKLDRDGLIEQLSKADAEARAARAQAESYKAQLAALSSSGGNLQGLLANLQQENANLHAQLDELNRKYAEAIGRIGAGPALPADLDNALRNFAAQNPDLVEFDSAKGIVKFKSDVTFASGDATLTPKAREAIGRFAQILNSPEASKYELLVAGHTDNRPVTNPATVQAGHKDNWYLSAHRAISVGSALTSQNVNPQRLGVVGYADQRPVASNASEAGKAQNRRVEVLILPNTVRAAPAAPANTAAPEPANPALNK